MAFTVLGRESRSLEEIATWRDHFTSSNSRTFYKSDLSTLSTDAYKNGLLSFE